MIDILFFDAITDADLGQVGGKGLSLGRMAAAGLPVPPGFAVTTAAYRRVHEAGPKSDAEFARAVLAAYHRLGRGLVAVRSSATAEDGAEASFAGQQETILGVQGDDAVLAAIARCWASLHTERAVAYRKQRGIADDGLGMAVVVQVLVPAEVAGVLFTQDPQDPTGLSLVIEASWGLGEAVVSGRVTPDRFRVHRESGAVVEKNAGRKTVQFTAEGERAVAPELQDVLCLGDAELSHLAALGKEVEAFYGAPRDVEWAFAAGTFHLLQARPITSGTAAEREAVRQNAIAELKSKADPRGTVWVRQNLSEVLPEPTPMTWAVVGRLVAADGGFGALNRDHASKPDPALGSDSAFDLVAGRPMTNLSKLPRLQFAHPPIEYPFAALKADPRKALEPIPVLNPLREGLLGLIRLPYVMWRLSKSQTATRTGAETFAVRFTSAIAPKFDAAAREALRQDWNRLDTPAVAKLFHDWVRLTLVDFARESLKPTVYADMAWATLAALLEPKLGANKTRAMIGEIALGAKPPAEVNLAAGVNDLANGTLDRSTFLDRFGHRCRNEMELSQPRWSEDPAAVDRLTGGGTSSSVAKVGDQIAAMGNAEPDAKAAWAKVERMARLVGPFRVQGALWAERLRTYLGLREAAKHYLLLGYAVIRRALVELDARLALQGGIFYLLPGELEAAIAGQDFAARIADRKRRRQLELSLEVPVVLFSDDLNAIGRPAPVPVGATLFTGIPLSAGSAEALALVLTEPTATPPDEPFVLVCPSTDPAWVPLFAKAKALVMETGGVLSHGAIVAREFGLPAVAGLPGITRQIRTGQRLRVDGGTGIVAVLE